MSTDIEISVPELGDFAEVTVIEVNVEVGDSIKEDDIVIVLESDKATLDVPSPRAGTVSAVKVVEGDSVSAGTPILTLSGANENAPVAEPVGQLQPGAPMAVQGGSTARLQPSASIPEQTPKSPNSSTGGRCKRRRRLSLDLRRPHPRRPASSMHPLRYGGTLER